MMIHPIIKSYGSKWSLTRRGVYPKPKFKRITEKCAGGAGYSLNHCEHEVTLIELDPDIVAAWRWILYARASDIRALPVELEAGIDIRSLDIPYGAACLIRGWQRVGRNDCWTVSKWNGMPGMWGGATRDRIARDVQKIRHWQVIHGDWSIGVPEPCTEFVDPEYQHNKGYRCGRFDYARLAIHCTESLKRGNQVIVCEQKGADWLPFRELVTVNAGCAHHPKKQSTEMIWP